MFGKNIEYWAVYIGMAIWLGMRDAEQAKPHKRILKICASGALAYGSAPWLSSVLGVPEAISVIVIMGFGLIALDTMAAILSEKDVILEFARQLIRRGK